MRRTAYIYQRPDWPAFRWDNDRLTAPLAVVRHRQGRLLGRVESLGFKLRAEATLQTLTQDALKTSEIEGEVLDPGQVRSSLARRLGLDTVGMASGTRETDAIAAVVLDATQNFQHPVTAERLFTWHRWLFPDGGRRWLPITVGAWRTEGDMVLASGPPDREVIHFEAPPAAQVPAEMQRFLLWMEDRDDATDPVLKAAVAHIWFVTIHPFDDGNGRIGRAITDLLLARSEGTGQRCYSMSARLRMERSEYYQSLEAAQKGDLDVTTRLEWFLGVFDRALADSEGRLDAILRKNRLWNSLSGRPVNLRQRAMLDRLLDGFEGKLTSSKWARMTKCSQDTALRDIADLVRQGILVLGAAGGRSTSYSLTADPAGRPGLDPPAGPAISDP